MKELQLLYLSNIRIFENYHKIVFYLGQTRKIVFKIKLNIKIGLELKSFI